MKQTTQSYPFAACANLASATAESLSGVIMRPSLTKPHGRCLVDARTHVPKLLPENVSVLVLSVPARPVERNRLQPRLDREVRGARGQTFLALGLQQGRVRRAAAPHAARTTAHPASLKVFAAWYAHTDFPAPGTPINRTLNPLCSSSSKAFGSTRRGHASASAGPRSRPSKAGPRSLASPN